MTNQIKYVHDVHPEVTFAVDPFKGMAPSNYGNKLPTQYVAKIGKTTYRVYAKQFSNVALFYIIRKYERLIVDETHLMRVKKASEEPQLLYEYEVTFVFERGYYKAKVTTHIKPMYETWGFLDPEVERKVIDECVIRCQNDNGFTIANWKSAEVSDDVSVVG